MTRLASVRADRQRGVAAVEFALVSVVFFLLLFGAMEVGRLLFYWNAAVEATRSAARTAVVCSFDAPAVKARVTTLLPLVPASSVDVAYLPAGCSAAGSATLCEQVTVSVRAGAVVVPTLIPFVSFSSVTMPTFSTTLTTESLQSAPGGVANPAC